MSWVFNIGELWAVFEYSFVTQEMGPCDVPESLENTQLFEWLDTQNNVVLC